jgi:hypothetical protein
MLNGGLWSHSVTVPGPDVYRAARLLRNCGEGRGFINPETLRRDANHARIVGLLKAAIAKMQPFGFFHVKYDNSVRFVQPTSAVVFHLDDSLSYWCRTRKAWRSCAAGSIVGIVNHKGEQVVNLPECLVTA